MRPAFHPIVEAWFAGQFAAPTPAQRAGWPAIAAGRDTLIAAPTGSGKTLAAFLWCLDRLVRAALEGALAERIDTVYVSPLKALGNDIERNLRRPLAGIRETAVAAGLTPPEVHVAVRSGDTPGSARARMLRRPPHILITTPESLYILLTSDRGRALLAPVRTVIVDEIHAIAGNKRGAHLALSLERLDALVAESGATPPTRIGLSATQRPIDRIGRLLVGARRSPPVVVDEGHTRPLDLAIETPEDELGALATQPHMAQVHDRMAALIAAHRTTLVFANTRRLAERTARALGDRLGEDAVAAHHGSLAKEKRLDAERRLQSGALRCVVATASLELGIDVGDVELVIQLGSPRCIATFLQRVGRAGHALGATPKGRLFAVTRDQAVECAALVRAVREGQLDAIRVLDAPLDILAQQIVAEVAAAAPVSEAALFERVRGAMPYAELTRAAFDGVLQMLSEGIATRRGRSSAHLHHDRVNGVLRPRRAARITALTSGGAIPERADYTVIAEPDEAVVGTLDEDFAIESMPGDVFVLGNTPWRIRRVEAGRVRVEAAPDSTPTIPFWFGEAPARTPELSAEVGRLRADVEAQLAAGAGVEGVAAWLTGVSSLPAHAALLVATYLAAGRAALGAMPTAERLIAERFFDEGGGMQLVVHAPLGGRINRAWGLALRKRFCVSFNFELQAAATDDGLVISLGPQHSFPLESVFDFVTPETAEPVLRQAVVTNPPLLGARWRVTATRGLAVPRWQGGRKVPPQIQRMRADDLLAAVFPDAAACQENVHGPIEPPDHPLINETLDDCMRDFMDVDGLRAVLEDIRAGRRTVHAIDTVEASPLCHELINANPYAFLDDAPAEERRTRAVALRQRLRVDPADGLGALDAAAIAAVVEEVQPPLRDADEVHDALLGWMLWPEAEARAAEVMPLLDELMEARRVVRAEWPGAPSRGFFVPSERAAWITALAPTVCFAPAPPSLRDAPTDDLDAIAKALVLGHMETCGPISAAEMAERVGLGRDMVEAALAMLEADGNLFRGRFRPGADGEEWCERRLLARIHRRTLARLRREIEPVSAALFMRSLFAWQHVAPVASGADAADPRLEGVEGLALVVEQLQGFEVSAGAWERHVLPARLKRYDPEWLDRLCLSGRVAWGRISPRTVQGRSGFGRAAPLGLALRAELDEVLEPVTDRAALLVPLGEVAAAVHDWLDARGACFADELARGLKRSSAEIADALWALAAAGLVTADGFANLRSVLERGAKASAAQAGRLAGGRWALLRRGDAPLDAERAALRLLRRYGVVFRDLVFREVALPPWREILRALRRFEDRGDVRGGRFVSGFSGEQFAAPLAVDALRTERRRARAATGPSYVRLSGADPLNLVGVLSPGAKVPPLSGNAVLYRDGVPIATRVAGEVEVRMPLDSGVTIDHDLRLHGRADAVASR
ncbi:MAG: DEAD/DEAH box helicase [Myxococcales bacterium]|nr:DEAD/DEAH box helicase [Myxococcales bacterium]